ncbi:MAG TPA: putative nucleotide-diphospho-sugar transferase [Solirubrobacteraceae bacterium]|nr:putative nucleotide-diphospho-sugar transferase [Solirubrobacteraceae bacterium]
MELDVPVDRLIGGEIAFYTFATRGFAPLTLNLHASLRRFDPALADRLIVFCADEATAERLATAGVVAVRCEPGALPESADFGRTGFGRVVSHKFALAQSLLRHARYVCWCDGDIVVQGALSRRVPELVAEHDVDLLMQHEWPKDVLNTGFWVARRSPAVDEMLADMATQTARLDVDDQTYFNERHAHAGALTIATLDHDEFRCGNRFYYRSLGRPPASTILHFNYAVGQRAKTDLMMQHGAWYLPRPRRPAAWVRLRYVAVTIGLRLGLWLADDRVGIDLDAVLGLGGRRRRMLQVTRALHGRLARRLRGG